MSRKSENRNKRSHIRPGPEHIENETPVFKLFAENAGQGFGMARLDGSIIYVNPALCRMLEEETPENAYKKGFQVYYPPEFRKKLKLEILPEVLQKGYWTGELELAGIKGKITRTLENFFLLRDAKGDPLYFADVVTDISEQKEMEMALLESSPNMIFINVRGRVVFANRHCEEVMGYSRNEFYSQDFDFLGITDPEYRDVVRESFRKHMEGKDVQPYEYALHTKDGRKLYAVLSTKLITYRGDPAILGMVTDITERRNAEIALKENDALLRATLESIISGILVVNEHGKVTHTNRKFAEMWKIPGNLMDSLDDDTLLKYVLDQLEEPGKFLDKVKELYQTDRIDHDILRFKDGRYFERISHPLLHNERISGRVWAFRDITERKNMELEISRINQELKESDAAKDKFFSIIAHDLKSPFSGLLGLSEVISDPAEELTLQDMRKYGARLHTLLRNQYHLLQNLLEWSRLQRGAVNFKPERLNLRDHIGNVNDQLAVNYLRKNITVKNDVDPRIVIRADADMLQSILLNLISNAIKFTNRGGNITLGAKTGELGTEVLVEDSGVGIRPDRLDAIFEIEAVSSTPGTDGEKGTGLGLILCREFVEKHGGAIRAESAPGKGSTIRFTLPLT